MYIIYSKDNGYWSNELGWVEDLNLATEFSPEEKEIFNLPMGKNTSWLPINFSPEK